MYSYKGDITKIYNRLIWKVNISNLEKGGEETMEVKEIKIDNGLLVKNIERFSEDKKSVKRTCPD